MLTSPSIFRALVAIGTGVLTAGGLLAGGPATASAPNPTTTVTILLKTPDQHSLNRLATARGLSHAERLAALAAVLPGAAAHRSVADELRSNGFTITHETAWTIDAQAPSATVASLFGTAPALPAGASPLQRARSAGALPRVPDAIASLTAAVLAKSSGPSLFTPLDSCGAQCHDGNDFRNAYSSPSQPIHRGTDANGPLTIATLQFPEQGGWNESDLTNYAKSVGLPDPVASGQYTQIPVDGATVPAASTTEGEADEEVDLDQESILSTAPDADQRAYFDTNANKAGYADALSQVLADVTQGAGEIGTGDPRIVALSTSWGSCESEFSDAFAFPHDTVTAVGNILKSLTAAGVTIFAASGDDGIYDCGDSTSSTRTAVDYPASSPQVVGVGGTRLKFVGNSSANNGSNWNDTSWSCTSATTCQGSKPGDTGGSGGGESKLFARPAYQKVGIGDQSFTTSSGKTGDFATQPHRLVPDIADDGDPATGFRLLTTDPNDDKSCSPPLNILTCKPISFAIGGTSLSSPEAASLFTDMLAAHGVTAGVGDIHDALYSAYAAHQGGFRDIKSGRNGNQADLDSRVKNGAGHEIPVNAQKGYDTVTGLGAPLWPALAPYIFTPKAPTARGLLMLSTPKRPSRPTTITATWSGKQARKSGSAPAIAAVTIVRDGHATPIYSSAKAPAAGSHTFTAKPGSTYTLAVAETDLAGQTSTPVAAVVTVPYDDSSFRFHGVWRRTKASADYAGSHATSDAVGASATVSATGRLYELAVRQGPSYGKLAVYQGARKVATIDLYHPTARHLIVQVFGTSTTPIKRRTFTFRFTGQKSSFSRSPAVDVDAFYAYR
jgi:hypothetical protein